MFKPLLAPGEDPKSFPDFFKKLRYPLLGSPKLDGIRSVIKSGACLSRTGKILPSTQVQEEFSSFTHFDGEFIEGNVTDFDVYNRTQSHIMSFDKPGDISYHVFDYTSPEVIFKPFYERLETATALVSKLQLTKVRAVVHEHIDNYDELIAYENKQLALGYEGIMMRDPIGRYKPGRATFNEGIIYKLKRFTDDEGVIVDFVEQMTNNNEKERDELGYAKRSSSKDGLEPAGTLGMLQVLYNGQIIDVAPGKLNHAQRKHIWDNKEEYRNTLIKFRYFAHGIKDKPRFPRAIGFRNPMDL